MLLQEGGSARALGGHTWSWHWGRGTGRVDFPSSSVEFPKKCQLHKPEGAC